MVHGMTETGDDQEQSDHFKDFAPERVTPVAKKPLSKIPLSSEDEKGS